MSLHVEPSNNHSNKQLKSYKVIQNKCKNDHFSYQKQLPIRKNVSSYTSAFHTDIKQIAHHNAIQQFRKKIAPPTLNANLLKRSLHQSTLHYSPNKVSPLPNIVAQSSYKNSFYEKDTQLSPKGKAQDGFFLKMSWHDSPQSNYRKSYQKSNVQPMPLQKSRIVQDHLQVFKRKFKGNSTYEQCYSPLLKNVKNDSKDCIKNKDHLTGVNCSLKGQTEYHSKYQNLRSTINCQPSEKQISDKKRQSFLPKIKKNRSQIDIKKKYLETTHVEEQIIKLRRSQAQGNQPRKMNNEEKLVQNNQDSVLINKTSASKYQERARKSNTKIIINSRTQDGLKKDKSASKKNKSYYQSRQTYKQNINKQEDLNISKKLYQKGMKQTIQIGGKIAKKSTKLHKTKSNPVNEELSSSSSTHDRIFGVIN